MVRVNFVSIHAWRKNAVTVKYLFYYSVVFTMSIFFFVSFTVLNSIKKNILIDKQFQIISLIPYNGAYIPQDHKQIKIKIAI